MLKTFFLYGPNVAIKFKLCKATLLKNNLTYKQPFVNILTRFRLLIRTLLICSQPTTILRLFKTPLIDFNGVIFLLIGKEATLK
jgi:hypothetical protein